MKYDSHVKFSSRRQQRAAEVVDHLPVIDFELRLEPRIGRTGWQTHALSDGYGLQKVDPMRTPIFDCPRRPRHAGHDRLHGAARNRQTRRWRDRGSRGSFGCGRLGRRQDGAVAGNHPNVAALVYIAAFALDEGESCASIEQALPQASKAFKPDSNGNWWIDEAQFAADFAADIPPEKAWFMAISQVPISTDAFTHKVTNPAWRHKPTAISADTSS
jgi:hypothetical protein